MQVVECILAEHKIVFYSKHLASLMQCPSTFIFVKFYYFLYL